MPETAEFLGAFIRWLFKGCKTNLRNEIEGNYPSTWGGSYEIENYVIGLIAAAILIFIIVYFFPPW